MASKPPTPTDRLITRFIRAHQHDWSQANKDNAVRVLNRVHDWLADADLTLDHGDRDALIDALQDYLQHRRTTPKPDGTPYSEASLLVEHRQLCAFYKWTAKDPGDGRPLLSFNPMRMIDRPQPEPPDPDRQPVAAEWQYDALMATTKGRPKRRPGQRGPLTDTNRRDAAMMAVLWFTGIRRSELCNIDYDDLKVAEERIHLPRTKGGRRAPRARSVKLPPDAMNAVDLWLDERGHAPGPLFGSATRPGARLEPQSVTLVLRRRAALAATKLGVTPEEVYTPAHSFRRASAIAWLDVGESETTLMENHGWSTNKMIRTYTGPQRQELAAAAALRVAEARSNRRLRAV